MKDEYEYGNIKKLKDEINEIASNIEDAKNMLKSEKTRLGNFKGQITSIESGFNRKVSDLEDSIYEYDQAINKAKDILQFDINEFIKNNISKHKANIDKTYNFIPDEKVLNCLFLYGNLIKLTSGGIDTAYWRMISYTLWAYLNPGINIDNKKDDSNG